MVQLYLVPKTTRLHTAFLKTAPPHKAIYVLTYFIVETYKRWKWCQAANFTGALCLHFVSWEILCWLADINCIVSSRFVGSQSQHFKECCYHNEIVCLVQFRWKKKSI